MRFIGLDVVIANPMHIRAISHAKVKNDQFDARTLAELLAADLVPSVWIDDEQPRLLRRLTSRRTQLVRALTRPKNEISRQGRISKRGSSTCRHVLVDASWSAIKTPGPLRAFYQHVRARRGAQVAIRRYRPQDRSALLVAPHHRTGLRLQATDDRRSQLLALGSAPRHGTQHQPGHDHRQTARPRRTTVHRTSRTRVQTTHPRHGRPPATTTQLRTLTPDFHA